jgi:hypothetical protein
MIKSPSVSRQTEGRESSLVLRRSRFAATRPYTVILGSCGQLDISIDIIPCKRIWQINNGSHAFPEALGDKKQFRLEFNSNLKAGIKTGGKPAAQRKDRESISRQRDSRRQPFFRQADTCHRGFNGL